jgi:MFS family permease
VHRITGASGAARTGLGTLTELTAAGSMGDAFVAVSLAGTIFFSTSVDQARGRVALFLLVTMAPFAVLAPFIGPALDRMQQGRRYLLAGTLLARGLLCWGMSAAVGNPVTLLPAAFGILVLQKCYGVIRASVVPRLLPARITLVAANARSALMALIASSIAAPVAAGVDWAGGAAWVLRAGTIIYLAAIVLALRLPDHVDVPVSVPGQGTMLAPGPGADPHARPANRPGAAPGPAAATRPDGLPGPGQARSGRTLPLDQPPDQGQRRRGPRALRTLGSVGPVVAEAMRGNAVLRAFSGYMIFFLAFLLRTGHFGVSHNLALGAMVAVAAAGGLVAMGIGSVIGSRAPQILLFGMLIVATIATAACAWFFGFGAALVVAFISALGTGLAKLALDSIVQREISEDVRSSAFAVSETLHQLSWVVGGLAGLLVSLLNNGQAGLAITAACLATALFFLVTQRRHRLRLRTHRTTPQPADTR